MNALVGVRANTSGLLSAGPAQRRAVEKELQAAARAMFLGRMKAAQAASPAAKSGAPAPKSAAPKAEETPPTSEEQSDDTVTRVVNNELGKDAFLQLLVQQMQNQDPLEPVDNSQMIAQLAQFSALEQMNNLNENFAMLSGNVDQLNFISANSLIGKEITGLDIDGNVVEGVVERVHMDGSLVYLAVGDQLVSMAGVIGIGGAAPEEGS